MWLLQRQKEQKVNPAIEMPSVEWIIMAKPDDVILTGIIVVLLSDILLVF